MKPDYNKFLGTAYSIIENPYKILTKKELDFLSYLNARTTIVYNEKGFSLGRVIDFSIISLDSLYRLLADYVEDDKEKLKAMIFDPSIEKIHNWVHTLIAITGINYNDAKEIALARIDFKRKKILELIKNYDESNIYKREIMKKWTRHEPLKQIKDISYGLNIINSHTRHKYTDYDDLLAETSKKVKNGQLKKTDVKKYARSNYKFK